MKLIIFDLDGTLAESKQPLTSEMADLLAKLLAHMPVGIISGGALSQFLKQVVGQLPSDANLSNLYLLPTSGAALYEYRNDDWQKVYEERLSEKDKDVIEKAVQEGAEETGVINFSDKAWGERIEYRGGQVSFSALGQQAPVALKKEWDPTHSKRRTLQEAIQKLLPPRFTAAIGGMTTIDVTKTGVDKAYGVHQLCERLKIKEPDALYVGDELSAGGNDEAVFKTEVKTEGVANPLQTEKLIKLLLNRA
jgi:HAD superfamily hydrolase (TIGR01484 family)